MKKKIQARLLSTEALEGAKGGFVIVEDNVVLRDENGKEYIVIEDQIIFRDAP